MQLRNKITEGGTLQFTNSCYVNLLFETCAVKSSGFQLRGPKRNGKNNLKSVSTHFTRHLICRV